MQLGSSPSLHEEVSIVIVLHEEVSIVIVLHEEALPLTR